MTITRTFDLSGFHGTDTWHRYKFPGTVALLTEGVHYVAEEGHAWWLIDAILSHQIESTVKKEDFQAWKLFVNDEKKAILTATDGNDKRIAKQEIDWTDFPLRSVEIWLINDGERKTLLLPSEY